MKKKILSLLVCAFISLPSFSYAQDEINESSIGAAVLADYETGDILYSYNLNKRIEIASITKIMTYLVAMDEISKGNAKLDDMVVISEKAARRGGASFKLKIGQSHSLEKLIESSIIASANDASISIAEHIAGNEKSFIEKMNEKARELKLEKSYFVSVNGFPEGDTHNTMTSKDILKLIIHTINTYPQILDLTSQEMLVDETRGFQFINTNPLLGSTEGVVGLKTGYSDIAGYCLTTVKNTDDSKLIAIVMGAGNKTIRKKESLKLLEGDIANAYRKEKILASDKAIDTLSVPGSANGKVKVFAEKDIYGMITGNEEISKTTTVYNFLEFPVKPGQVIGEITVKYDDNVKKINLVAREELVKSGVVNTVLVVLRGFLSNIF